MLTYINREWGVADREEIRPVPSVEEPEGADIAYLEKRHYG